MTEFRMPSLGADMDEGTLIEWLKRPGDNLSKGDIVAVVETQKGAIEIEVFHDGILEQTHAMPGARLPVGALLGTIRAPGEILTPEFEPVAAVLAKAEAPPKVTPRTSTPPQGKRNITPAARHGARLLGIDLTTLSPAPDGIIGLRELAAAAPGKPKAAAGINLAEMRKAIAAAMARSKRQIPHYYVNAAIDVAPMVEWLAAENARRAVPDRLLSAVPIIKACALALAKVPELNGHYLDQRFMRAADVKIGIGIALRGGGLIAPALARPDALSLEEIMRKLADLVARVRGGRLRSSELTEPTVTLSNLGDDSADSVLPIIYPPQVAIIGVGQIADRPWVSNGALAIRKVAVFTVAGDHRASDGRSAARFLRTLDTILQKPEAL